MWRVPLTCFPIMPLASGGWTFVCLIVLLFHFRHLERRWGSPSFLTFVLVASLLGRAAAQIAVPGSTSAADATRIATLAAAVVPISALCCRYYIDIPSLEKTRIFGNVVVSEKVLIWGCALKVLLFPFVVNGVDVSSRLVPVSNIPILSRLLMVLAGAGLAFLIRTSRASQKRIRTGARKSVGAVFMDRLAVAVATPIVRWVLQPLFLPVCGSSSSVQHYPPPNHQAPNQQRGPRDRAVGNLVGDDADITPEMWEQIRREQEALNQSPTSPNSAARTFPSVTSRSAASASLPPVDHEKVALLESLGLGVTREAVVQALIVCNGDVETAAAFLFEHH